MSHNGMPNNENSNMRQLFSRIQKTLKNNPQQNGSKRPTIQISPSKKLFKGTGI
jgi:hypothetical protein